MPRYELTLDARGGNITSWKGKEYSAALDDPAFLELVPQNGLMDAESARDLPGLLERHPGPGRPPPSP